VAVVPPALRPIVWNSSSVSMRQNKVWGTLAVVLDLYARKVVGWSMDARQGAGAGCPAHGGVAKATGR